MHPALLLGSPSYVNPQAQISTRAFLGIPRQNDPKKRYFATELLPAFFLALAVLQFI